MKTMFVCTDSVHNVILKVMILSSKTKNNAFSVMINIIVERRLNEFLMM